MLIWYCASLLTSSPLHLKLFGHEASVDSKDVHVSSLPISISGFCHQIIIEDFLRFGVMSVFETFVSFLLYSLHLVIGLGIMRYAYHTS